MSLHTIAIMCCSISALGWVFFCFQNHNLLRDQSVQSLCACPLLLCSYLNRPHSFQICSDEVSEMKSNEMSTDWQVVLERCAKSQVHIFHQSRIMPAIWLGDLAETRCSWLLLTKHLGPVAVLYVPAPRCRRLVTLNLNLAECVSLKYET